MSDVTYSDVPNDPMQPLAAGPLEPIEFTCVRALDWLMVDMGAGYEECAFREGAFRGPYAAHSTISGDLLSGTVMREGGWLAPPMLIAQVVPAPVVVPTEGLPLGSIYEVDLTAQPSQAMATAGSYDIDGRTWWMKGTLWTSGACELVDGAGLRLFAPATIGGSQPNRPNFRGSLNGILQRIVTFPFAQLADYNPAVSVYCDWRLSGTLSNNNDRCSSLGIMTAAASAAPITDAERATCAQVCHFGYGGSSTLHFGALGNLSPTSVIHADSALSAYRTGVLRFAKNRFHVVHKLSAVDIDPETQSDLSPLVDTVTQPAAQGDMSAFFTLHKAFSDGQTLDVYLTHLRVMQAKVAA